MRPTEKKPHDPGVLHASVGEAIKSSIPCKPVGHVLLPLIAFHFSTTTIF